MNSIINIVLKFIAYLPFWWLYKLAYFFYLVIYYVIGLNKKKVGERLKTAFPTKSDQEINKIRKNLYKNLVKMVFETVKTLNMTAADLMRRIFISENEESKRFLSESGSAIILTAHLGNWEWAEQLIGLKAGNRETIISFLKVKNRYFNAVMLKIRGRFGNKAVRMEKVFRTILENKENGVVAIFPADLEPGSRQKGLTINFLNQERLFFTGPENIATSLALPVYYMSILKEKRGHYRIDLKLITNNAAIEPQNFVTQKYSSLLEKTVLERPESWAGFVLMPVKTKNK